MKNNKNCKVTINDEEVEKYTIKPETADKMFEKLGYKKYCSLQTCRYVRNCNIVNGEKEYIIFSKNKTVRFQYLYTQVSKSINKVSKKKITVTQDTYNKVMQRDNCRCRLCGTSLNLHLHHIDGRGKDLTNDINNCIMLCRHCHLEVVHKNQKKYRPILKKIIENTKQI